MLIYSGYSGERGVSRRFERHFFAIQKDFTVIRLMHAGDDFYQGGLPGSVFAHQSMDLTALELEIHIVQRLDAGEVFCDTPKLQNVL
jgi:hypothetical protein